MIEFTLNGQPVNSTAELDTPLLWIIRDELGLKGTKFGCGIALCGACTVHFNGAPMRSCILPLGSIANGNVRTIEGLGNKHPLQQAWLSHQVPQCGYCQSGQLMQATALLASNANPSDADIDSYMSGNLCRCMTYPRIKQAIKDTASQSTSVVKIYDPKRDAFTVQGVS